MLIDKLKDWQYYYQKLPLYVRRSYGTSEHFKILFDLLVQIDVTEDVLFRYFDIMASNYLDFLRGARANIIDIDEDYAVIESFSDNEALVDSIVRSDDDECQILDFIAAIYGVSRIFDVGVGVRQSLHLTDEQLLLLIKQRIIQYNYDGSYKTANKFYESVGLPIYIYNSNLSGTAELYLNTSELDIEGADKNIYLMFMAGLFTIQSMGISYKLYAIDSLDDVFIWDSDNAVNMWDAGLWL